MNEKRRIRPDLRVDNRDLNLILWFIDHTSIHQSSYPGEKIIHRSFPLSISDIHGNDSGGRQPLQGAPDIRLGKILAISKYFTDKRLESKPWLRELASSLVARWSQDIDEIHAARARPLMSLCQKLCACFSELMNTNLSRWRLENTCKVNVSHPPPFVPLDMISFLPAAKHSRSITRYSSSSPLN